MSPEGTSFIPKSGVKTVQKTRGTRRIYVLAYISYIVFFSTLFAVIGVYVYGATVSRSLTSLREQMVNEQQRFSLEEIDSIKNLHERLSKAQELLNESSAPSRIFEDVERIVASNIYFSGMRYELMANRQFQIELIGRADNFNEIISQRDLLGNSTLLQEATVVDYDYSVGEGEASSVLGLATLSFVFSDTRDVSSIAYLPEAVAEPVTPAATTTENVVLVETATSSSPVEEDAGSNTATTTEVTPQ